MANFGKSFSDSFDKSMAVSQAGNLDLIKEKIKLDATKAEETAKVKSTLAAASDIVDTIKNPEMKKLIESQLATKSEDGTVKPIGHTPESAKGLFDLAKGASLIEMRQQAMENRMKGAFVVKTDPKTDESYIVNALDNSRVTDPKQITAASSVFKETLTPEQMGARTTAQETAGQKFFKEPEIADIRDIADTRDTLKEVVSGLDSLGIKDVTKFGNVEMETIDSNFGKISIPARFNIAAQYTKDPKYVAIQNKLERAFNKYRKIITGAQASNQELNTLRKVFSAFTDRPGVFFENTNTLIAETDRMLKTRFDIYDSVGRDTSKLRKMFTTESVDKEPTSSSSKIAVGTKAVNPKTKETLTWDGTQWA
jgi:hypothetical protein